MLKSLADISLRANERGFLVGGTATGKSTLEEALIVDFHNRYAAKGGRVLIVDSKPRFRAAYRVSGRSAARLYRRWQHGPIVPDSVRVTSAEELPVAWATGARIAIAQGDTAGDIPALVDCVRAFFDDSRRGRPQLVAVDEVIDFFHGNAAARGGSDALVRCARAGRERGLAALYCSQRTRGIPATLLEELAKLYLFRLDYAQDAKRLQEMGAPASMRPPRAAREFRYWTKDDYDRVWPLDGGTYTLDLRRR